MQLGVFPLPIILFPNGITRLRIFEPRYVRLVKQAAAGDGFALSVYMPNTEFNSSKIAAWVERGFASFLKLSKLPIFSPTPVRDEVRFV